MNLPRLVAALVVTNCLLGPAGLRAQEAPPFTMGRQYSADVIITTKSGLNIKAHTYLDGDKMRSDTELNDTDVTTIVRKDTKKLYHIMESHKIVMTSNFDPAKATASSPVVNGPTGKFELVGPDTVDGLATTKYKVTSADGKVNYFWMDSATHAPVQMMSSDGAMTVRWKNYKPGPQDPSLFEPPANFQIMDTPSAAGSQ